MSGEKTKVEKVSFDDTDEFDQQNRKYRKLCQGKIVDILNLFYLKLDKELKEKVEDFKKMWERKNILKRIFWNMI